MFIDEFEEVNSLPLLQKKRLFNDIRHLIDTNIDNFNLIIACTPHGWETLYEENAALVRRFSANIIFLEALNPNNALALTEEYLQRYRNQSHLSLLQENSKCEKIFPFTKDAIVELCSLAKGNIGEYLKYCSIAIEMSLSENLDIIDASNVSGLIAKYLGQ